MRMLGTTLPLRLVTTANARVISHQSGEGLARPWSSSTSRPAGALPQRPRLSRDPLPKVGSPEWHEQEEEETLQIFDLEPLPAEHPFRHLQNVLATPHIGYGRCERGLRCASLRFTGGSMRRIAAALALA